MFFLSKNFRVIGESDIHLQPYFLSSPLMKGPNPAQPAKALNLRASFFVLKPKRRVEPYFEKPTILRALF